MNTQSQLLQNVNFLQEEISKLRSFVIGIAGKDKEGNYKPEFVQKVLASSRKPSVGKFDNSQNFLKLIEK